MDMITKPFTAAALAPKIRHILQREMPATADFNNEAHGTLPQAGAVAVRIASILVTASRNKDTTPSAEAAISPVASASSDAVNPQSPTNIIVRGTARRTRLIR